MPFTPVLAVEESDDNIGPNQPALPMRGWIMFLLVGAALLLFWVLRSDDRNSPPSLGHELPGVGSTLPGVYLEPLTGTQTPITPQHLQGKVVLINYWGPWCGYCAKEFPDLVKLERQQRANKDFLLLSISSDGDRDDRPSDLAERTAAFLQRYEANFPTYVDRGARNRSYLATLTQQRGFGFPMTILLDRAGTITHIWHGYDPAYGSQMETAVAAALAQP